MTSPKPSPRSTAAVVRTSLIKVRSAARRIASAAGEGRLLVSTGRDLMDFRASRCSQNRRLFAKRKDCHADHTAPVVFGESRP
jgi:hypothetical protein